LPGFIAALTLIFKEIMLFVSYVKNNAFPQPLSEEEEEKHLQRMAKGDAYSRNLLIEHNLRLVAHIVKKFENTGEDNEDLISIGTIGLIKAIESYQTNKGTKLATYAARCIENEILMLLVYRINPWYYRCIIDSGVMQGHPLLGPAIGDSACFPAELGDTSDVEGHGTKVAGLALYGDVLKLVRAGAFKPEYRIFSARVTNADNKFDDEKLITTQMREAIRYFHDEYGCKIYNVSLGDDENVYEDGKQTLWASVLDELIRELDIVVIVSAGNHFYYPDEPENILSEYPGYLFNEQSKIIDPASAALALTVGSYCSNFVAPVMSGMAIERGVNLRVIGKENFPSPFTRTGPGVRGAIKPELCEYGGNLLFDGLTKRIRDDRSISVLSTSKNIPDELFTTDIGTSFASPQLSHKAAQLYKIFPDASFL
jgi:hypothetical protein